MLPEYQTMSDVPEEERSLLRESRKREWVCYACTSGRKRTYRQAENHAEHGHGFRNQARRLPVDLRRE